MVAGDMVTLPEGAGFSDHMDGPRKWVDCGGLTGEVVRVSPAGEGKYSEMAWIRLPMTGYGAVPFSTRKLEEWAEAAA
jgi:hypothetical protein